MLMIDPEDESFVLGDRGLEVSFCAFCEALRVSVISFLERESYSPFVVSYQKTYQILI